MKLDTRANGVVPGLILEGLMPTAPWKPTVAFKIRVLELYRVTHVRCPHLAIQAFVKSLCDLHGVSRFIIVTTARLSGLNPDRVSPLPMPEIFDCIRPLSRPSPTH